tara:strand:- start:596 stop:1714 length:1119 start_codon:yes stop_codon:yes gene_type:complete
MTSNYTNILNSLPNSIPFVGPEAQERILDKYFDSRIGANESVFGPSPKAIKVMKDEVSSLWMYGDPENYDLKFEIAKKHNVKPENIIIGEGIDGLLGYLVRMFVEPNDKVVTTDGSYPTFNYHVNGYGGLLKKVPFKNDLEDLDSLLKISKTELPKVLYVSNPNNPMGTFNEKIAMKKFVSEVPKETLICLDEAYADFVTEDELIDIDINQENIIRMRTFSKAYGLAGARIGYGIGHEKLIKNFDKIRNHFGMNRVSQHAAIASLKDNNHLENVILKVKKSLKKLEEIAISNNCRFIKSYTNFLAIDCGYDGIFAKNVLDALISNGIFVRMPFTSPENRCIRVTVGTQKDLKLFEEKFPLALINAKTKLNLK